MPYDPETGQWVEDDEAGFQSEVERLTRAAYPPRPTPMPPQSPDVRLGRFNLPGNRLDAASLAVLQALQNQPAPQGFGANFVSGLAQGFAGGRVRNMSARQQQYEAEREKADRYNRAAESFRGSATLAAQRSRQESSRLEADMAKRETANQAAVERQQREFEHRERMQQLRFNAQMQLLTAKSQIPESPGKLKTLSLMVTRMAQNDPDAREFVVVRDFYNQGIESLKAKDSFGDLMAIRALAKVSDKLTGIREGEYDTFEKAAGILMRYGMLGPKMIGRGTLTQQGRDAIARELGTIYKQKLSFYNAARTFWGDVSNNIGVDPSLTVRDLNAPEGEAAPPAAKTKAQLAREERERLGR